ncbi:Cytochrome P450 4c3 [Armadillidium nasatum]|uniref:Cytochrome P450 4c3 n=1 Tax=Armadillidium nasatum TaxID=96803 RepID=A0A5N5SIU1_9CRUS|nr:Cytochrome P450 4c3 [Armadillidium nasatum]
MMKAWLGIWPYVFVFRCDAVEVILSSSKHIDKSSDYRFIEPWLGTGLLTSKGKKWQSRRKMLTPAFHFKILEDFIEVFNLHSSKFVTNLKPNANGELFNIFPSITLCTLDIILETAMGTRINAQDKPDSDYVKAVYKIGEIIQVRQCRPWLHPNILFKLFGYAKEHDECLRILHGFSYDTIRQRRHEYEMKKQKEESNEKEEDIFVGKRKRLAFLDLLLEYSEEGSNLTDEDIREEVDTFMFEGHDTTAAAINWTIYLLGSHPKFQEKVHEELDSIFGDSDRPATSGDLRDMKYLECCIKESLRLFPSVPIMAREITEDAHIDNYTIPKGTTALITTYRLHRDEKQFPDPEEFIPDRFSPDYPIKRHPYAYIPFSAGPRNCIGQKFAVMEEKIVLSSFFRNYRVESTVKREDLLLRGELILRPEDGNFVKLFPRK